MDGQIILAVKETSVLKSPLYVSISNDNKNMFVTDIGNEAVHEFIIKGVLKDTTKTEEMGSPLGSTVTNCGCAVVCYPDKGDKVGLIVSGTRKILPFYLQIVSLS
jgi:sugar lactone lactonase YvrE